MLNSCRSRFFEHVATGLGAGLLVLDANESILWLNPVAEKLLGYAQDELLGRPVSVLEGVSRGRLGSFEFQTDRSFRSQMTRRDGSKFWADCLAGKVSRPEEAGFTLVFHDITEKKEEEDELLLSAKVFEFSGEGIMITDTKDAILKVNDAFVRMTGYSAAEVVEKLRFYFLILINSKLSMTGSDIALATGCSS